jgi:uncharacterized protein YndB with AHSA1/START domain
MAKQDCGNVAETEISAHNICIEHLDERENIMRVALKVIAYLIGLIVLLLLAGLLLPSGYKAERNVTVNAPAEKIFPLIANTKSWKQWTVWNQRDPNMQITYSGPESAAGAKWSWKSKSEGDGAMEFTAVELNKRLAYTFMMENMNPSTGEITLNASGNATKVTWTMMGESGMNPISRWFGYFIDWLVGPDFEASLANLKKVAES